MSPAKPVKPTKAISTILAKEPGDISTGIPNLDLAMNGGYPKGSVVLLSGGSGTGKTILAFQWLFRGIKENENGLYISLTEPLFKTVHNLEVMKYYDRQALEDERLKILDMRDFFNHSGKTEVDRHAIIKYIESQVKEVNAKRLCIDSITAIAYRLRDKSEIRDFIFDLGRALAGLGCTTILTSEVGHKGEVSVYGVEEFISDVIILLETVSFKNQTQRKLKIIKVRGKSYDEEELYFTIKSNGLNLIAPIRIPLKHASSVDRLSIGNTTLDEMLFGGLYKSSSTLIVGPTGAGKTLLSVNFLVEGLRRGEKCLYVGFEESRDYIVRNASSFGWDLEDYEKKGLLVFRCAYPSEKFLEEHLADVMEICQREKIQRCAVDSLSAVADSFTFEMFMKFSRDLSAFLKSRGITSLFTSATSLFSITGQRTESHLSTTVDNIVMMRYAEMEGELRLVLNIVKIRGSAHSKGLRIYDITNKGIVVGPSLTGYEGVTTGVSRKVSETTEERLEVVFKKYLGPMSASVFYDIKSKGLTEKSLVEYVKELTSQGILTQADAEEFLKDVANVFRLPSESTPRPPQKFTEGDI